MDIEHNVGGTSELFEAQTHIYRHILNYANSMALSCAFELGIPDIIHNHKKPISLQELVSKLNISVDKTLHLKRIMRLLIHSDVFSLAKLEDGDEKEGYVLTIFSKLLLKNTNEKSPNQLPSLLAFADLHLDPEYVSTWHFLGRWFKGNKSTAFETAHGTSIWEFTSNNSRFNRLFNDAMASNSEMMNLVIKDYKEVFQGVDSLVDVGGGTGLVAKILLEAFPDMNCIVLDLPHVVADMVETKGLKYVGGDMFSSIPPTNAIFLKNVLHDWDDENVLKILEKCKEAILNYDGGKGKVIIVDIVLSDNDHDNDHHETMETKLFFDILMMVAATGKERTKDEWEKLITKAGFNGYKITHTHSLLSIIEVYP